uniref:Uncharacterized protein n=1 Tax=Arundo donax TaxID=35708 RepID=A0A0A9EJF6_ARUDO
MPPLCATTYIQHLSATNDGRLLPPSTSLRCTQPSPQQHRRRCSR